MASWATLWRISGCHGNARSSGASSSSGQVDEGATMSRKVAMLEEVVTSALRLLQDTKEDVSNGKSPGQGPKIYHEEK